VLPRLQLVPLLLLVVRCRCPDLLPHLLQLEQLPHRLPLLLLLLAA
jgi:hypothetical protein